MGVAGRVADAVSLPRVSWTWEPETDILSGTLAPGPVGTPGTLELGGHDGSVIVLDLAGGWLAGLDVVVWPEVVTVPGLVLPVAGRWGALLIEPQPGGEVQELESALAVRASPDESVIHLRVGAPRPASATQVADHLTVEIDAAGGLAGFWLTAVPPLTSEAEPG